MPTISRNLNSFKHISRKLGALFLLAHNRKCPKLSMHFLHKSLASSRPPLINNNNIAIFIPIAAPASRFTKAAHARENMQQIDFIP